ncbi:hypothetical protein J8273_2356 [Carpediemonas membranifera]|uniref:Uncharacterized protein n=1 Tax=Carpediemonas membranifera TaxID=201153 RepID=A0A8J6E5N0_9EUKA|nr:hypothetical protein J8273_2356 [Carpediemonas membranifera]|eukprot:KAG9396007.1 hypothetical protein J8273_2356 [Carpediemonas membranifera]
MSTDSKDISRRMWQRVNPGYTEDPDHFRTVSSESHRAFDAEEMDHVDKLHHRKRDEFSVYAECVAAMTAHHDTPKAPAAGK